MIHWYNVVGWLGTIGFCTGLVFYIRYRTQQERDAEND